jgi:hypothetical protein
MPAMLLLGKRNGIGREQPEGIGSVMNKGVFLRLTLAALTTFFTVTTDLVSADPLEGLDESHPMVVNRNAKEVRILAELQPKAFSGGWLTSTPGHHAVTWKGGKKSSEALLSALVSDAELHDAMISIGARPGNNLTQAAWDERNDETSKAPDTRVEGSPVEASVWWPGLKSPVPLESLFNDPNGQGVDLRFGGQKSLIPVWKSGCIVCLQSCPGAKISNRSYTMRDYAQGKATFTLNDKNVPAGNRLAVVIFRLKEK